MNVNACANDFESLYVAVDVFINIPLLLMCKQIRMNIIKYSTRIPYQFETILILSFFSTSIKRIKIFSANVSECLITFIKATSQTAILP